MAILEVNDVNHFRRLLKDNITNLTALCKKWETTIAAKPDDITNEAVGDIDTAIGTTKLLMTERFEQFSELVDDCEFNRGEKKTLTSDLQGFWDMVDYQIEDVQKKFKALDELQANNWQKISVPTKVVRKKVLNNPSKLQKQRSGKSNFAAFKAQLKLKNAEKKKSFDGGFFQVTSPVRKASSRKENDSQPVTNDISDNNTVRHSKTISVRIVTPRPRDSILTPKRSFLPVVPRPLLHDITSKDTSRSAFLHTEASLVGEHSNKRTRRLTQVTPSNANIEHVTSGSASQPATPYGKPPTGLKNKKTAMKSHSQVSRKSSSLRKRVVSGNLVRSDTNSLTRSRKRDDAMLMIATPRVTRSLIKTTNSSNSSSTWDQIPQRRSARLKAKNLKF